MLSLKKHLCPFALTTSLFALTAAAAEAAASADQYSLIATPVFTEQTYHCVFPYRINPAHKDGARFGLDVNHPVISFGSGFFMNSKSGPLLITAKHTLIKESLSAVAIDGDIYKIDDPDESVTRVAARTRAGGLSIEPKRWMVCKDLDLAILELPKGSLDLLRAKVLTPSEAIPAMGSDIQMIGYPPMRKTIAGSDSANGSTAPYGRHHLEKYQIASISSGELTLNGGLSDSTEGGFSGGPVLNATGEVIGMVFSADRLQTRCIRITEIMKHVQSFDQEASDYIDIKPAP